MIKLIETLIGGAGKGSRRVQFAAVCLAGVVITPSLAWHFVSLGTVVVASLTVTDAIEAAEGE